MIGQTNIFLLLMMLIPFLGTLFALISKENPSKNTNNVLSVGIFTTVINLAVIYMAFRSIENVDGDISFVTNISWLETPKIEFVFGADVFSLLLIAAVHCAILLGFVGVRSNTYRPKTLVVFSMLFLGTITNYLLSYDLFSFYIFFEAMLLPLFMLVGIFGNIRKQDILYRFFIYNLAGAVCLFAALCILFNQHNVIIQSIGEAEISYKLQFFVWGAIFIAFLSRIPIWPFHYWISSINTALDNPLVFIIANLMPLTGVYGLIRFFPLTAPNVIKPYLIALETISIISMLVVALIGYSNKDIRYKIFSYSTVCYILYLLGTLLPTDTLLTNIGFSLFAWIIIVAAIEIILAHLDKEKQCNNLPECGILCNIKRTSFALSFFILAAVGMPLSSIFLNNMLIFAGLLKFNLKMTIFIMLAMVLSSLSLLQYLFYLRYPQAQNLNTQACARDISAPVFILLLLTMLLLFVSFINPSWYIG
ncbi:MAG: hypothetical protein J6T72_03415 [Alphaproteobacteria bacterium]|nr:hypothetical protein [Alphaproteobacteria bacterium]